MAAIDWDMVQAKIRVDCAVLWSHLKLIDDTDAAANFTKLACSTPIWAMGERYCGVVVGMMDRRNREAA